MPTWEAGNSQRGFTLIELLVVVAVIAIASAGVSFALRDASAAQLDREALRLAALLDAARGQSRASGQVIRWRALDQGFVFEGAAEGSLPQAWLQPGTRVLGTPTLVLGPEPLIPPQEVRIAAPGTEGRSLRIATDGLKPFQVIGETGP